MQPRKHKITITPTPDSPSTVATLVVFDAESFDRIVQITVRRRRYLTSPLLEAHCSMRGMPSPDGLGFWSVSLFRVEEEFTVLMLLAEVLGYHRTRERGFWTREFQAAMDLSDALKAAEPVKSAA